MSLNPTTTITIKIKDHQKLVKISSKNSRKLIDQFHVIIDYFEEMNNNG